jgi:uncharacterized protein
MNGRDINFTTFECTSGNNYALRGSYHATNKLHVPCVIFCHGFTGHRLGPGYLFVKLSRAFAEADIASARFDFCGTGESEGLFSEMHTGTMMHDLSVVTQYLRNKWNPSRIILCGHSLGGMIAARQAAPLGVDGLILLSPIGDPKRSVQRNQDLLETGPNTTGYYENGPHEMSISFLNHLLGFDPVEELTGSYTGPLLLFQGDADSTTSVDESYRYISSAEHTAITTDYHLIEGCDHNYSRVTDVNKVLSTITSWIKEHFGE